LQEDNDHAANQHSSKSSGSKGKRATSNNNNNAQLQKSAAGALQKSKLTNLQRAAKPLIDTQLETLTQAEHGQKDDNSYLLHHSMFLTYFFP
jgi:hypothetical protein